MMELLISSDLRKPLQDAGIREADLRRVLLGDGGVFDLSAGTITKAAQLGSITLWVTVRGTETGHVLERFYSHRMTVDGVEPLPDP